MSIANVEGRSTARWAHSPAESHVVGSDLMRGQGARVVSAWRHMAAAGNGLGAHEKLFALIVSDIESNRAGYASGQTDIAAWVCKPYVNLARSFGQEHWPVLALREFLQHMGQHEGIAEGVGSASWGV